MRKTIKYLENGEYHYATVKDVGDLAKLKTDSKEDLVAAINDLFINGGENAGKPEGYDKLVEQLTNAIKEQQGIKDKIDTIEKNDSNQDTARKQEIEELRTQQAEERAKADKAYNELVQKVESDINEIVESNKTLSSNLDTQTMALRNDLNQTKNELEQEKGKLYNASEQIGDIDNRLSTAELTVKQNQDSISQMATKSELDLIDQSVKKQETELKQQADEIKLKASQSDLDSVSQKVTKNTSDLTIANDAISAISSKQIEQGQNQQAIETKVVENAEGIKQISTDLQSSNNKIEKFEGKLESTAHDLKTQYEQYTNNAIGKISDSSLNKILNSSFTVGEDHLTSWQNISDKVNVEEDGNGLMWARIIQSGQNSINPVGLTSNYFNVKQGYVTVSIDIKEGQSTTIDDSTVIRIELYDDGKKRLNFQDVTLEDLGLSIEMLNDHNAHRGLYRYNIDRSDVKQMTVRGFLNKNGDLSFTNFSARLSSIDNGDYTPNPDDYDRQIVKMNTSIEQNAKEIKLKATSAEVDNKVEGITSGLDDKMWSIARSEMTAASDNFKIQVEKATKTLDINPNLYTGTADFSGTNWVNKQFWVDDGTTDPEGNTALKNTSQAGDGLGQMYDVEVGQYTFSCWLMLSDDSNVSDGVMLVAGTGSLGETAQIDSGQGQAPKFQFGDETAKWQKVTWTFNVVISGWLYVRPELQQNTGTIRVGSYKLEKGDVATRWCQNTRELVTVNNVISSINVSPEEIKLASNKIVLDGETTIKDTLNVGNVSLKGINGEMKFDPSGIELGNSEFKVGLAADRMNFSTTGNDKLAIGLEGFNNTGDNYSTTIKHGKITTNQLEVTGGNIQGAELTNNDITTKILGDYHYSHDDAIKVGHDSPTFQIFKHGQISMGTTFWRQDNVDRVNHTNWIEDVRSTESRNMMIGHPDMDDDHLSLLPITTIWNTKGITDVTLLFDLISFNGADSRFLSSGMLVAWDRKDNGVQGIDEEPYGYRLQPDKVKFLKSDLGIFAKTDIMMPLTNVNQSRTATIDLTRFKDGTDICLGLLVQNPKVSDNPANNVSVYFTIEDFSFTRRHRSTSASRNLWAISHLAYGFLEGKTGRIEPVLAGTCWHTDFIPTKNNKFITVTQYHATSSPKDNHDAIEFYDKNKKWIADGPELYTNVDKVNFTQTIGIPDGAAYVRISMPWCPDNMDPKYSLGIFKWEFGDKSTPWSEAPEDVGLYDYSTSLEIDPSGMLSFKSQSTASHVGDLSSRSISFDSKGNLDLQAYVSSGLNENHSYDIKMSGDMITFGADPHQAEKMPRLTFLGNSGTNGVFHDSYGNIHGLENAGFWRVHAGNDEPRLDVPISNYGAFTFTLPNTDSRWRTLKIGWVHFSKWDWAGNVPALYQDNNHISGVALWDRFVIPFVDNWAMNLIDTYNPKEDIYGTQH